MANKSKPQTSRTFAERGTQAQPISSVTWVHRDKLHANNYNPNSVAPAEMVLLSVSILEDGWCAPILVTPEYQIIDGFHRWTVSGWPAVYALTGGKVPVVVQRVSKTEGDLMMSTVRLNRARGTHGVMPMRDIVCGLLSAGLSKGEIMERLQMEGEEVVRLAAQGGIPASDLIAGAKWSKSWVPGA